MEYGELMSPWSEDGNRRLKVEDRAVVQEKRMLQTEKYGAHHFASV